MGGVSLELWYAALGSNLGVCIDTSHPEKLRQRLYKLRADAGDPLLDDISIIISPTVPGSHVWLVKRKQT